MKEAKALRCDWESFQQQQHIFPNIYLYGMNNRRYKYYMNKYTQSVSQEFMAGMRATTPNIHYLKMDEKVSVIIYYLKSVHINE